MKEQVTIALWIFGAVVVNLVGNYLLDRVLFGKAGVRGYWPRAALLTILLGGGIALIWWKML